MSNRIGCLLLLWILSVPMSSAYAQSRVVTTSSESRSYSVQGFARDFWFSVLKNYDLGEGKFFEAYITSQSSAIVSISVGKTGPQNFKVGAMEVLVFRLPLAWEMTQSATIEDKAIHVWSDDADLSVSVLSHASYSADGLTVLPVSSWGKEYVVAAYASYAYYPQYDYPSEFAIIASEDNTIVTIKPSCDLREGLNPGVAYPSNQTFTVTLNRGQAVQYQATAANGNEEDHDVTGTVITSSKPIGVEAGVVLANVPVDAPSADHLCEMLLPVDRWGKTYYTAPFAKRHGGDGILVIAAEDNTRITRTSPSGVVTHAILNKFGSYMRFDIDEASQWTSDKPFMLVQYMLGEDYPDQGANAGVGAPSMVAIPSTSLYQKEVAFHTPKLSAGSAQYTNYSNVIVHKNAVNSTMLDGKNIAGLLSAMPIPGVDYIVYQAANLSPGAHFVSSDSGVGVYIYGFGISESYAWPGPMGAFVTSKTDTTSPIITSLSDQCYSLEVRVADLGSAALGGLMHSIDSTNNFSIKGIAYQGDGDSILYSVDVMDSSRAAFARVTVVDAAGNRRIIEHSYTPDLPVMPEGVYVVRLPVNTSGQFALPIAAGHTRGLSNVTVHLKSSTQFQIISSPGSVNASQTDSIRISYYQPSVEDYRDTLVVSAECWHHEIALRGSPTPVFGYEVRDTIIDFGLVVVGNSRSRTDKVYNIGTEPFTVDSIVLDPTENYAIVLGQLPAVVPMGDTVDFSVRFSPKSNGEIGGRATVFTSLGNTSVRLTGQGKEQAGVGQPNPEAQIRLYPNPAQDLLKVSVSRELLPAVVRLKVTDVTGREMISLGASPGEKSWFDLDIHTLPEGMYLLELQTRSGSVESQKFTIKR